MNYVRSRFITAVIGVVVFFGFQNCAKQPGALGTNSFNGSSFNGNFVNSKIPDSTVASDSDLKCLRAQDYSFSVPQNLKYFGVLSSMGEDSRNFEQWKQYVNASLQMGNTQIVDILNYANEDQTVAEFKRRVDYIYQFKQKIIVNVQEVFFSKSTGLLKSGYGSLWNKLVNVMKSYSQNPFVAVYLYDEPYWNAKSKKISVTALTKDLNTAGGAVKKAMPSLALVFVEAYPMVNSQMVIPEIFDWVGTDCYVENCNGKTIFQLYDTLKALLRPHQKLVTLPTAMVFKKPKDFTKADSIWMKDQFLDYAQWLAQQTNVIASFAFIYHYSLGVEDITGAESSCETSDILKIYAKQAQTRSTEPASYLCNVSGSATSLSIFGSMTVSKLHTGMQGHYFVGGFDVIRNQWYTFDGNQFTSSDFTENTISSIPSPASGLSSISGPIFANSDVSPYKGGLIYLAYGLGSSKWTAFQEMMTNHRYVKCATIPHQ